jgi:adenosylcobyric acid synthase
VSVRCRSIYLQAVGSLMVQGVSSGAGKSLLVCGLCRSLARRGIPVAPFKAQNMSNNARVVDGGEIGTAQWLQALAARVTPEVRMNPVLLKPENDLRSQVVVLGRASRELTEAPWRGRSKRLWPAVLDAFESLRADYDVIVLEGAGSPAESNLWDDDIVNMAMAEAANACVLLVADIDRGGAFAHLYGTWALLPPVWRRRIKGFVLNRFRGDPALLDPAPAELETLTGVPTVGVVPWLDHHLPDEEGPSRRFSPWRPGRRVALVCGPYASNLDEFAGLQQVSDVRLLGDDGRIEDADLVILPGSKHVAADLAWLRRTGLAEQVLAAAAAGVPVLGICGGLQALGTRIEDPAGVEGEAAGLGLLPIVTTYDSDKRTVRTTARFGSLPGSWAWLEGRSVTGYEIRHGRSEAIAVNLASALPEGLCYALDNVIGVYLHGLFENDEVLKAFSGSEPEPLDSVFDGLADAVDLHIDDRWLARHLL